MSRHVRTPPPVTSERATLTLTSDKRQNQGQQIIKRAAGRRKGRCTRTRTKKNPCFNLGGGRKTHGSHVVALDIHPPGPRPRTPPRLDSWPAGGTCGLPPARLVAMWSRRPRHARGNRYRPPPLVPCGVVPAAAPFLNNCASCACRAPVVRWRKARESF